MTDRELIEFAAMAAGIMRHPDGRYWVGHWWNPLDDDGDALRLAGALGFEIDVGIKRVAVRTPQGDKVLLRDTDTLAAIRRAIVIAAAEIGKNMETK